MVVGRILTDPIPMTPTTATALLPLLDDVLDGAFGDFRARLIEEGYGSIRPGHGCVFGHIDGGGSRLTDLASDSGFTKQAVGEAVADLESLGFVERAPDPDDGRAKIIRLTAEGEAAQATAGRLFAEIERAWAESYGAERVALLRELIEEIRADQRKPAAAVGP
ncbi:MAG: MarR family winged helix-turn-helix transcriptional regulator [Solirubrobacterales bacterium]